MVAEIWALVISSFVDQLVALTTRPRRRLRIKFLVTNLCNCFFKEVLEELELGHEPRREAAQKME